MKTNLAVRYRIPMLMAGFISLMFGMYIGLTRLGWNFPLSSATQFALHGPLMVCGFLGTVISLERAVAIGERWAYSGPLASAAGAVLLIAGISPSIGTLLAVIASAILSVASIKIFFRQRELFTFTLLIAALCWLLGCVLWLCSFSLVQVLPWWMGFLIITIVGERLELSRFMRPSYGSKILFVFALLVFLAGAGFALLGAWPDFHLLSASLIAMTLWLMRNDIVRHTIKQQGLTRYIAAALICGYAWLLIAGIIGLSLPQLNPGSSYDAFTHAIFLGFVFSMIFGHAPIIFPAITKVKIPYHPSFYLPLFLLQASLLLRLSGDFFYMANLRKAGGILHAITIVLFILVLAASVIRNKNKPL
jgi:F0F1-type ATP synthase membrane subunit c/vacuolar-type H+-ATPase subunit K